MDTTIWTQASSSSTAGRVLKPGSGRGRTFNRAQHGSFRASVAAAGLANR
jgi:hypothetical protein